MRRICPILIIPLLVGSVFAASCGRDDALAPLSADKLSLGTWGGDSAGVIVSDSGTHIHIGCTLGDIAGTVTLDAEGNFVRDGSYQPRAYPVAVGPTVPARFTGNVDGRVLRITVVVNDTIDKITRTFGPVTVVLGIEPRLGPCPICRMPASQ